MEPTTASPKTPRWRLTAMALAPDGKRLAATVRGKLCAYDAWGVGVRQLGQRSGVRYRLPRFVAAKGEEPQHFLATSGGNVSC